MENNTAAEFMNGFIDSYPPDFTDRYEPMECLSHGQTGETLLVRDKFSGRLLVAKCYEAGHPFFGSTEPDELRGLSHPGLPAFEEEFQSGAMRCILREYVIGKTIWELNHEAPFTQETVRSVGIKLCGILKYLHSQTPPVIHRDIKPQNIVMREDGSPVLIDMGISRVYDKEARSDTLYCGTEGFAPPEQYGFMQTDCRSDIYSLGILLAWMMTGKAEPIQNPRTPLERVIVKCAAFAPSDRFRDAEAVEKALRKTRRKSGKMRWVIPGAAVLLVLALLIACGFWLARRPAAVTASALIQPPGDGFTEPLIEEAVRMMLGKDADDPISAEELASVTELYITHDTVCPDMESFYKSHEELCGKGSEACGPVTSLRDLSLLTNLKILCVAAQQIKDISPLASLPELFQVELRLNGVSDISPLAGLQKLSVVGLNSNPVADISPLASCSSLRQLDLCGVTGNYDASALALLGDLDFLDISNPTDSYLYLGGKNICELKLSRTAISDLSCLNDVAGIQKLELCDTGIADLSGLEKHPEITYLNLCNIPATDFSVLLKLPNLETAVVSAGVKEQVETIAAQGTFTVIYQD